MFNPLTPHTPIDQTGPGPDPARQQHILELEDRITALSAHIDAATFQFLELVREYDDCGGWAGPGLRSSATAPALLYLLHPCSRARIGSTGAAASA
jgi:hypothetical protein